MCVGACPRAVSGARGAPARPPLARGSRFQTKRNKSKVSSLFHHGNHCTYSHHRDWLHLERSNQSQSPQSSQVVKRAPVRVRARRVPQRARPSHVAPAPILAPSPLHHERFSVPPCGCGRGGCPSAPAPRTWLPLPTLRHVRTTLMSSGGFGGEGCPSAPITRPQIMSERKRAELRQKRPPLTPPPPPWGASPPCPLPPKAVAFRFCLGWAEPQPGQKLECPYLSAGAVEERARAPARAAFRPALALRPLATLGTAVSAAATPPPRRFYRLARCATLCSLMGNCLVNLSLSVCIWLNAPLWGAGLVAARPFGRSRFCWCCFVCVSGACARPLRFALAVK